MSSCCRINHTVILDDPFDDPPDLPVPDRSPEPTKEQLDVSAVSPLPGQLKHVQCAHIASVRKLHIT